MSEDERRISGQFKDATLGERFKDARTVHNKNGKQTIKEVHDATSVSASTISDLENDKDRSIGFHDIVKLANHYGISIDDLLGTRSESPSYVCEYTGLSPQAIQKLHSFNDYRTKAFLSSLILEYNGDFHDIFADISTAIDLRTIQKNNGDTPSRKTEGDPNRLDPATLDSFMRALGRKTKNTPDNPDLAVINLKDALSLKLYNAEKCFRRFIEKYVDKEETNDEM